MKKSELVIGKKPLIEALDGGQDILKVFLQKDMVMEGIGKVMKGLRDRDVPVQYVPKAKLDRMYGGPHQGVIATISPIEFIELDQLLSFLYAQGQDPLLAMFDGITDVRNLGAISRSALAFGVNGLIIPSVGFAGLNALAIKSSAGALLKSQLSRVKDLPKSVHTLRNNGLQVVAISEKGDSEIHEVDWSLPTTIIMGDEGKGISNDLLRMADKICRIPISPEMESLNVSVAAGICFYEAYKNRTNQD